MASTRRDRNKNFFKWEPVEGGNARLTPNVPLNWFYELVEWTELAPEEESSSEEAMLPDPEEFITEKEILKMTPPNDELLKTAQMFPPPPEWFEGDEDDLF